LRGLARPRRARPAAAELPDDRRSQPGQFDEAHIPASVCIPIHNAGFGSRLAWIADHEHDIVLVGRDDEDGRHAAELAVAIGMRRLAGFLGGGMTSWRQERRPTDVTERIDATDLPGRLDTDHALQVLDVRDRSEWDRGHLPGSTPTTWHDIPELPAGLDRDKPIALICGSGQRAATGASLVRRQGAGKVLHVVDGGVPKLGLLGVRLETTGARRPAPDAPASANRRPHIPRRQPPAASQMARRPARPIAP
jgi:hydroxyacylglutathione hydrolase